MLACLLTACGPRPAPLAPEPVPDPIPSEPTIYACGGWQPAPPPFALAVFDLDLNGEGAIGALRMARAEILHVYHVPRVRARLSPGALPALESGLHVSRAEWVSLASPLEFWGWVWLRAPLDAKFRSVLESLGVKDIRVSTNPWLYATIPDHSVPAILAHPEVAAIGLNGIVCATLAPARPEGVTRGFGSARDHHW